VGIVSSNPVIVKGGHVFFDIISEGIQVRCAVYKPTGLISQTKNLVIGDKIRIGGGIRKASKKFGRLINIEFIDVIELVAKTIDSNPLCIKCKKRMKSKGTGQGFQCIKCGSRSQKKFSEPVSRKITQGLHVPVVSAHRHLTRPMQRFGRNNSKNFFNQSSKWFEKF